MLRILHMSGQRCQFANLARMRMFSLCDCLTYSKVFDLAMFYLELGRE